MSLAPATALLAGTTMALAACGGGSDASWCVSGNGGGWFAGYNHNDCPPAHKAGEGAEPVEGAQRAPTEADASALR